MPIDVTCLCGKAFKVKDEFAGREVRCQVCGAAVSVPALSESPIDHAVTPSFEMFDSAPAITGQDTNKDTKECPACAENIPRRARRCPACGEDITRFVGADEAQALLQETVNALEAHIANPASLEMDRSIQGGLISKSTIFIGILTLLSGVLFLVGMNAERDGDVWCGFGAICGMVFGLSFLVAWSRDRRCAHIQDAPNPRLALKRYFLAIRTGRWAKAYTALTPTARKTGSVCTLQFIKIPTHANQYAIQDPKTFKDYWMSIFRGPSLQSRTVRLGRFETVSAGDGFAVVETEFKFTNHSSLLLLLILVNILLCALVIFAVQKKENKKVRKLLLQRDGRWFVAEGEFEGALDRVCMQEGFEG